MTRAIPLLVASSMVLARPVCGQRAQPVAAHYVVNRNFNLAPHAADIDTGVGPAPYILLGTLLGAGAATLYWVHVYKTNNGADDGFFIPPGVFVTVGLGGLAGGAIGYMVYGMTR